MYSKRLARYPKLRQEELSAVSKYLLITKGEIARLYGVTYTYLGENKIYLPRLSKYLKGFRRCAGKCKEVLPVKDFINEKINRCRKCLDEVLFPYRKKYDSNKYKTYEGKMKSKARNSIYRKVKLGKLIPGKCSMRGEKCKGRIEAHHYLGYEYEHWLDVQWLCHYHHMAEDKTGLKYLYKRSHLTNDL